MAEPQLFTASFQMTFVCVLIVAAIGADHIGGMATVLKNFGPKELWVGVVTPSQALQTVIATAQSLGVKVVRHWEGDEFNFGGATVACCSRPAIGPSAQGHKTMTR